MKKTKVICHIGPSSNQLEVLRKMILNGMDVACFDLGRLDYSFCSSAVEKIHELELELDKTIGIMFETRGQMMRLGVVSGGKVLLKKDSEVEIFSTPVVSSVDRLSISYPTLLNDVRVGMEILLKEGKVKLKVTSKKKDALLAVVEEEGFVYSHESLLIPHIQVRGEYLDKKNKEDIRFALREEVDFLTLSSIRSSNDVMDVTDLLIEEGNNHIQLITKVENQFCFHDLSHIIGLSDGVMVSRVDLENEFSREQVLGLQKKIIDQVHRENKLGIVKGEIFSSMVEKEEPLVSEVSDLYHIVMDGVDAVSFDQATSLGNDPSSVITVASKILEQAEQEMDRDRYLSDTFITGKFDVTTSLSHAAVEEANRLHLGGIVALTNTGYTAKRVSSFRPSCPILAVTSSKEVSRSLVLHYGVIPVLEHSYDTLSLVMENAKRKAKEILSLKRKDSFVIIGSMSIQDENTNFMKIEEME